jgi:hypothetical protein
MLDDIAQLLFYGIKDEAAVQASQKAQAARMGSIRQDGSQRAAMAAVGASAALRSLAPPEPRIHHLSLEPAVSAESAPMRR